MPNKRNFSRLIARLKKTEHAPFDSLAEKDTKHFNMARYHYECGAPACMSGHASQLATGTFTPFAAHEAAKFLGLDEWWARNHLFNPDFSTLNSSGEPLFFRNITPEHACRALTKVRDAGKSYQSLTLKQIWRD